MKVAAAQIACVPGNLDANLAKIRDSAARAKEAGVELIVFPEMSDTGYSMPMIQKKRLLAAITISVTILIPAR